MKKILILSIITGLILLLPVGSFAQVNTPVSKQPPNPTAAEIPSCDVCNVSDSSKYAVGVDDILDINVLKPDELSREVTVAPDGAIEFPYIGRVIARGRTIVQIQDEIQTRLADGYIKYPVVSVSLKESLSRKFFVYGEVEKPGSYQMDGNTTVLRAISMAGGFTRFGSSSNVKVLRAKNDGVGYDMIKVNIKGVMNGDSDEDVLLKPGDIVTVSEGVF